MAWRGEKIRFWIPVVVLGICLVGLAARLVVLHLGVIGVEKEPTYKLVHNTVAVRGSVYSSTGVPYARTKIVWEYAVDPKAGNEDPVHAGRKVKPAARWANITNLAETLNLQPAKVMDAYAEYARRGRRYVLLATNEDETVHARLSGIHELSVSEKLVRVYPQGKDLSQIVGFIGFPTNTLKVPVGVAGIEQQFEKQLRGTPGHLAGLKNAHGQELRLMREINADARPGNDQRQQTVGGRERRFQSLIQNHRAIIDNALFKEKVADGKRSIQSAQKQNILIHPCNAFALDQLPYAPESENDH